MFEQGEFDETKFIGGWDKVLFAIGHLMKSTQLGQHVKIRTSESVMRGRLPRRMVQNFCKINLPRLDPAPSSIRNVPVKTVSRNCHHFSQPSHPLGPCVDRNSYPSCPYPMSYLPCPNPAPYSPASAQNSTTWSRPLASSSSSLKVSNVVIFCDGLDAMVTCRSDNLGS